MFVYAVNIMYMCVWNQSIVCVVVFLQEGLTALMWAVKARDFNVAVVEVLVAAGANKDLQDKVSTL